MKYASIFIISLLKSQNLNNVILKNNPKNYSIIYLQEFLRCHIINCIQSGNMITKNIDDELIELFDHLNILNNDENKESKMLKVLMGEFNCDVKIFNFNIENQVTIKELVKNVNCFSKIICININFINNNKLLINKYITVYPNNYWALHCVLCKKKENKNYYGLVFVPETNNWLKVEYMDNTGYMHITENINDHKNMSDDIILIVYSKIL
jgi:hypothetical protein